MATRRPSGETESGASRTTAVSSARSAWVTRLASRSSERTLSVVTTAAIATAQPAIAATPSTRLRRARELVTFAATPASEPAVLIQRSSDATSSALCQRSSGSFARHLSTTCCSAGGVSGCASAIGGGCSFTIAAIRLVLRLSLEGAAAGRHLVQDGPEGEDVGAGVRFLPLELLGRHVLERAEDRSVLRSEAWPRWPGSSCPSSFAPPSAAVFASPKSSSFAPDFVSMTLPGLRSRWVMPWRCAACRAEAICWPYFRTS